ncbi:hypothetical protein GCM10008967_14150 [Bacillus carboniphilus]|uniref:Uncharacterized protein n=1 Tax=Bacillus carboniphilus TaxID=86663 RepID=A0ABP3FSK6_9BACI
MKSEVFIDFCFIRKPEGNFKQVILDSFAQLFEKSLHWYASEKMTEEMELVLAEVKGMGKFQSEEEVMDYLEAHAPMEFWGWLQGYQINVYPNTKGCKSCGT